MCCSCLSFLYAAGISVILLQEKSSRMSGKSANSASRDRKISKRKGGWDRISALRRHKTWATGFRRLDQSAAESRMISYWYSTSVKVRNSIITQPYSIIPPSYIPPMAVMWVVFFHLIHSNFNWRQKMRGGINCQQNMSNVIGCMICCAECTAYCTSETFCSFCVTSLLALTWLFAAL